MFRKIELSFLLLGIISVYLSVSANKPFNWDERIEEILKDIKNGNEKYEKSGKLKHLPTYDFVIVGTGSAGSTCAAGILEKAKNAKILMIEAGSHVVEPQVYNYTNGAFWIGSQYDWNDPTEYEEGLFSSINVPNGFAIGGSSTINFMFWIRGDPDDFNSWAKLTGDVSWRYENLLPYFKKVERFDGAASLYRGDSGDVYATESLSGGNHSLEMQNILSAKLSIPKNVDFNGATPYGIGHSQINVKPSNLNTGTRQDAFTTQLNDHLSRPNFHVLTSTYGDKVVLNEANDEVLYLVIQRDGVSYKVRAKNDYVISAGSMRSPLVLMRSGIGNCSELQAKGIECRVNLPAVGKNLDHHPTTFMPFPYKSASVVPPSNSFFNSVSGKINVDGTDLPKHQIISVYTTDRPFIAPGVHIFAHILCHHRGKGEIELRSSDPTAKPIIRLNTYKDPQDLADQIEGLQIAIDYAAALNETFLGPPIFNPPGADLATHARTNLIIFHPTSTCRMGKTKNDNAVVDSRLRVFGVKNLRVVDASIMPYVTSFNTNNPSMMIGAKGAGEIIQDYY